MVGLNAALMVQLVMRASEAPQMSVNANWLAPVPVSAILEIGTAALLVFVSVLDCAALEVPWRWLAKLERTWRQDQCDFWSRYRPYPVRLSVPSARIFPEVLMKTPLVSVT